MMLHRRGTYHLAKYNENNTYSKKSLPSGFPLTNSPAISRAVYLIIITTLWIETKLDEVGV
jgi:hypothetical protein